MSNAVAWPARVAGRTGRSVRRGAASLVMLCGHTGAITQLLGQAIWHGMITPLWGQRLYRGQLMPLLSSVGVRSFPIVMIVSALTGAILILQTGDVLQRYGQLQEVPGVVALSFTRELGPVMCAVVMTARVGASFTAVLAAMEINEEIMALRTMAIGPVAWLVAPRLLAMVIMVPCLTVLGFLVGMLGGALLSWALYDISFQLYVDKTVFYLDMIDVLSGIGKSMVFGVLITGVCCYFGLTARGGPTGLGRYIMISVVTAIVVFIIADAILTAVMVNYLL